MKQYKVRLWIGYSPTEVTVMAFNSAGALSVARKIYPMARVIGATEAKL